jgi:AcrR family transcriptional regulator
MHTKSPKWPLNDAPRIPLDRDKIARTALILVDTLGIEQLTMRRLGAELGVEAMALYHYFQNKDSLLDGILDVLLEQMMQSLPPGGTPLERLRTNFLAMRQIAIDHPQAFVSVVSRRFRNRRALVFFEGVLRLFHAAGLNAEQSARYYRVLSNFTLGGGIMEVGSDQVAPLSPVVGDDGDQYPLVRDVMPHLHSSQADVTFRFGLDLILAALKSELDSAT